MSRPFESRTTLFGFSCVGDYAAAVSRVFQMGFSSLYPCYVTKVERKGRSKAELDQVIKWLTGFDQRTLNKHIKADTTLTDFFADATIHSNAPLITGVICGVRIEEIEDPLMKKIRYLDKLVDELAKGRAMEKILRS
jgi:hypothetical protein